MDEKWSIWMIKEISLENWLNFSFFFTKETKQRKKWNKEIMNQTHKRQRKKEQYKKINGMKTIKNWFLKIYFHK